MSVTKYKQYKRETKCYYCSTQFNKTHTFATVNTGKWYICNKKARLQAMFTVCDTSVSGCDVFWLKFTRICSVHLNRTERIRNRTSASDRTELKTSLTNIYTRTVWQEYHSKYSRFSVSSAVKRITKSGQKKNKYSIRQLALQRSPQIWSWNGRESDWIRSYLFGLIAVSLRR